MILLKNLLNIVITDKVTLKRLKTAHPDLRDELHNIYKEIVMYVNTKYSQLRFTDVLRTIDQQNYLYEQGRTRPGNKVTWVKGGYSYHNYGMAVDICFVVDKDKNGTFEHASWDIQADWDKDSVSDWLEVVKIFNKYGWQWGLINSKGKRYDLPHFQKTLGYKTEELKKMDKDENGYPILTKLKKCCCYD